MATPYDPLDLLGLPVVPGYTDPEQDAKPIPRNCLTCRNRPTCVPYQQGGAFLQAMGFTSTTPSRKTYGGQHGSQKVSAPTAAMLPMGCGGNAWQPLERKPIGQVVRMFEDYVPDDGSARPIRTNPLDHLGDKGLPM